MIDFKLTAVAFGLFIYLYSTPIGIHENQAVVERVIFNISHNDIFDIVTNPDCFDKWFRWISKVSYADAKFFGEGKKYSVIFVRTPIIFNTTQLFANDNELRMEFEADTILRPTFKLKIFKTCSYLNYPRIKISLVINFRRNSQLFSIFMGQIIKSVAKDRMQEALFNLENILNGFQFIPIHKML